MPSTAVMIFVVSMSMPVVTVIIVVMSIPRHIFVVVPIIPYEVDRSAACTILPTMLVPVFLMSRRNVQVDRLHCNMLRRSLDDNGLCEHDRRPRNIADINLTVETGLTDADGHAYISGKRRNGTNSQQRGKHSSLHDIHSPQRLRSVPQPI
jgi:hypothetical protein